MYSDNKKWRNKNGIEINELWKDRADRTCLFLNLGMDNDRCTRLKVEIMHSIMVQNRTKLRWLYVFWGREKS